MCSGWGMDKTRKIRLVGWSGKADKGESKLKPSFNGPLPELVHIVHTVHTTDEVTLVESLTCVTIPFIIVVIIVIKSHLSSVP